MVAAGYSAHLPELLLPSAVVTPGYKEKMPSPVSLIISATQCKTGPFCVSIVFYRTRAAGEGQYLWILSNEF